VLKVLALIQTDPNGLGQTGTHSTNQPHGDRGIARGGEQIGSGSFLYDAERDRLRESLDGLIGEVDAGATRADSHLRSNELHPLIDQLNSGSS